MPRRLLGVFILLLVSMSLLWAQGDVVLLTVGGEKVSLSEFKYHWQKSSEKRADVFVETYGRFKQKVLCAKELRLDTLSAYVSQKDMCLSLLRHQPRASQEGAWIKLMQITYPLKQDVAQKEIDAGCQRMDSLYAELKSSLGDEVVKQARWIQEKFLLDEWRACLASLDKGEVSQPFFSPLGIHLVVWTDRWVGPFSENEEEQSELAVREKEIVESLLIAYWDEYLSESTLCSETDLMNHFKENREEYGGGIPHFKGAVIHCQSKKEAKAIKKLLKKYPEALWKEALGRMSSEISVKCRMDVGLFKIGVNPYVDKLAFGCGEYETITDYPYSFVFGKKMKKGPDSYWDVRRKVEKDCLEAKKTSRMEGFMQKYTIEIDKEQLKSVNRAENK